MKPNNHFKILTTGIIMLFTISTFAQNDPTGDRWDDNGSNTEIYLPDASGFPGFLDVLVTGISNYEKMLRVRVDDANDFMSIENNSSNNAYFMPTLKGHRVSRTSGGSALMLSASIDSAADGDGLLSMMIFDTRRQNVNFSGVSGSASEVQDENLFLWRNYTSTHMIMDVDGQLGINETDPQATLHVDGTVRFENLSTSAGNYMLVVDNDGDVFRTSLPSSGTELNCATTNYIPKVTGTDELDCSQIQDDGSTVGINGTTSTWNFGGGIGTQSVRLYINGNTVSDGYFWSSSDVRFKRDITPVASALDKVTSLEGVSYNYRTDEFPDRDFSKSRTYGLIAQNVEEVIPELVATSEDGYKAVNYSGLIPVLVEAIKEQQTRIEELEEMIAEKSSSDYTDIIETSEAKLFQNYPNPFNETTYIEYTLPDNYGSPALYIYDMNGRQIDRFVLTDENDSVEIQAGQLAAGMYIYTLIVDGREIDTKRMILTD